MDDFAVLEATYLVGRQRNVVRPLAAQIGACDLAPAARHRLPTLRSHRRRTAISLAAGTLNWPPFRSPSSRRLPQRYRSTWPWRQPGRYPTTAASAAAF